MAPVYLFKVIARTSIKMPLAQANRRPTIGRRERNQNFDIGRSGSGRTFAASRQSIPWPLWARARQGYEEKSGCRQWPVASVAKLESTNFTGSPDLVILTLSFNASFSSTQYKDDHSSHLSSPLKNTCQVNIPPKCCAPPAPSDRSPRPRRPASPCPRFNNAGQNPPRPPLPPPPSAPRPPRLARRRAPACTRPRPTTHPSGSGA